MTRAFESFPRLLVACVLAPGLALAADTVERPVEGDPVNGGRLFRLHCAACHGVEGEGNGPLAAQLAAKPTNLRDGGFLWALTTEELLSRMRGEKLPPKAPPHGRGLTDLELRDLAGWIAEPVPTLSSFFPASTDYVAHIQTIDDDGLERAEKILGRELKEDEKTLMLFAMMKGDKLEDGRFAMPGPDGSVKIEDIPQALYEAKPKRRMGFVGYVPLNLKGGRFMVGLALNRTMHIVGVATVPTADEASEKLRVKLASTLASFEGAGGREGKKTIVPQKRGVKASKDVLDEMEKAYVLVLEAGAMYQKEERDRFWADPDAFRFPSAADMQEVDFDFKESKRK